MCDFDVWIDLYSEEIKERLATEQIVDKDNFVECLFLTNEQIIAPITSSEVEESF